MQQRLFEIVWHLTRTGGATAAEMAERFGVSQRTIYRDIDALSGAGIPVYTEKGRGGGIRLLPDFVLDKTLFTRDEQAQLLSHFESLASLGTPDTQQMLDKLGALFGQAGTNWLEVDFAPWDGGEEMRTLFRLLRNAILQRHVVQFHYHGNEGPAALRTVEPYRVMFRGQGWYLHGYCLARRAFRYFKLTRMTQAADTGTDFMANRSLPPENAPFPGRFIRVQLKIDRELAHRVRDEFHTSQIAQTSDGHFMVEADFPAGSWLCGYLLSLGPAAEVVSPPALRRQLADMLHAMQARYTTNAP